MVCRRSGRYYPDILSVRIIIGKHVRKLLGKHMAVHSLCRSLKYLNVMLYTIDEDDDITPGLALKLNGVKSREFQKGTEKTSNIAVHHRICLR